MKCFLSCQTISQLTHDSACPPLSRISMHGISVALAVTWLSHSSQYILYPDAIGCSLNCHRFLDPLRQDDGLMMMMVRLVHVDLNKRGQKKERPNTPCKERKKKTTLFSPKPSCRFKCSVNAACRGDPRNHRPPGQCLPTPSLSPTAQTSSVTASTRSLAASFDVAKESQDFQSPSGLR